MQKCVGGKLHRVLWLSKGQKLFPVSHSFYVLTFSLQNSQHSSFENLERRKSLYFRMLSICTTINTITKLDHIWFLFIVYNYGTSRSLSNFRCLLWTSCFPVLSSFLDVCCWGTVLPGCVQRNRSPTMYPINRNVCDGRIVSLDKTTKPKSAAVICLLCRNCVLCEGLIKQDGSRFRAKLIWLECLRRL